MIKIGNIEIQDYLNQTEEKIDEKYNQILEKVKDTPDYLEGTWLDGKTTWIEAKELLKYRKNIIEWIPMNKDAEVLEIMSGCGTLTECIANKTRNVVCLDLSKTKSLINAYRNKNHQNIEIYVSDYKNFLEYVDKKFDSIIWIDGLVDYKTIAPEYETLENFLESLQGLLKENGKLICAVNNPFGLRYFAGFAEDYTGRFFEGISGYPFSKECKGYPKTKLEEMLRDAKYKSLEWYYPYPDYMYPVLIYSDQRMPQKGELWMNMCNLQHERLALFDEERVYDYLIENNMFSQYSNSYLVIAERE